MFFRTCDIDCGGKLLFGNSVDFSYCVQRAVWYVCFSGCSGSSDIFAVRLCFLSDGNSCFNICFEEKGKFTEGVFRHCKIEYKLFALFAFCFYVEFIMCIFKGEKYEILYQVRRTIIGCGGDLP